LTLVNPGPVSLDSEACIGFPKPSTPGKARSALWGVESELAEARRGLEASTRDCETIRREGEAAKSLLSKVKGELAAAVRERDALQAALGTSRGEVADVAKEVGMLQKALGEAKARENTMLVDIGKLQVGA
jgi:chromosome segregation ATPase